MPRASRTHINCVIRHGVQCWQTAFGCHLQALLLAEQRLCGAQPGCANLRPPGLEPGVAWCACLQGMALHLLQHPLLSCLSASA